MELCLFDSPDAQQESARIGDCGDTVLELPPGPWRSELTGEPVRPGACAVAGLLRRFPVALLARTA